MTMDQILSSLKAEFGEAIRGSVSPAAGRLLADIDRARLRDACRFLIRQGGRFQVGSGADERDRTGTFGLIHFFAFDRDRFSIGLRTTAPAADPTFDSITPDIPAAGWTEREYRDLLGMQLPRASEAQEAHHRRRLAGRDLSPPKGSPV